MSVFKLSKKDLFDITFSEAVGYSIGAPFVGAAASIFIKFGHGILNNTAEIKIPALQTGKYDKFLIQANDYLNTKYNSESQVSKYLPYVECHQFDYSTGEIKITIAPQFKEFELEPFADPEVECLREQGFNGLKEAGKFRHDSETIRVNSYRSKSNELHLEVQKARYSDQAKSNLILDFSVGMGTSIRKFLCQEFNGELPPISDRRLANTLGVAVLIFYKDEGKLTPYFVPRTKAVAVFNCGEWHCTASGAAEWPRYPEKTDDTFKAYILDDLITELKEEVGLLPEDISNLLPLAFCREFTRAGKPQLFFIGFTGLSLKELNSKLANARKLSESRNEPIEVHNMPFFRFPKNIENPETLISNFEGGGFTAEAAACVFYSKLFLEKHLGVLTP